jgi:DNA-binding LacI/PurR family transcriptional regulator
MVESSVPGPDRKPTVAKRPTMADVAARVGVSRALVSLVFRGAEGASPQTRERVFQAAAELGYRPDTAARLLRRDRSRHLGVVYAVQDAFQAGVVDALYQAAERHGYSIVLSATSRARNERKAVEDLLGLRSETLMLIGPDAASGRLAALVGDVPVVVVGRRLGGAPFDSIRTDDAQGVRQAVDHLVASGHRAIAHIEGGTMPGAAGRRRGYRQAMRRHGLDDEIVLIPGDYTEDSGARAADELLGRDGPLPTAVIACNDRCAVGFLDAMLRCGVKVPTELSVVGYDDSQLARLSHIDLTTVRQDVERTAEAAVQAAVEWLDEGRTEPKDVVLAPSLIVRSTTAPPRTTP